MDNLIEQRNQIEFQKNKNFDKISDNFSNGTFGRNQI